MLVIFFSASTFPAVISRDGLIAIYVYRLIQNINWPGMQQNTVYHIHILEEGTQLSRQMREVWGDKKIKGKSVRISRSSEPNNISADVQLVFVSRDKTEHYTKVFDWAVGKPVLLISDSFTNPRQVMINLVEKPDNKLSFEINKANILNQNLGIEPDIILIGGTEIDVARLYREAQVSLREQELRIAEIERKRQVLDASQDSLRQELATMDTKLKMQQNKLNLQQQKFDAQEQLIFKQKQAVIQEQARLKEVTDQVSQQAGIIQQQQERFEQERERYETLAKQSKDQQVLIESQEKLMFEERQKYEQLTQIVRQRELSLDKQEQEIKARIAILAELDDKIKQQDIILAHQSETISSQKKFLYALGAAVTLAMVLILATLLGYRAKRIANIHLREQKELLEKTTTELAKAEERANAANQAKSIFLANMSHELRTPLNAVLGISELMGHDTEITETQRENVDVINRSGHHLLSMINDVLDLSKIEAGSSELELEAIDFSTFIDDLTIMVRSRADAKGLQFVSEQEDDIPAYVILDANKLRQVLINLLGNALKFTDQGGVALRTKKEMVEGDLRLVFEIQDSGIGIANDKLDSIFKPFVQVGHSPGKQQGTGLGLAISYQLVHLMDGEISVESKEGKGSVFRFYVRTQLADKVAVAEKSLQQPKVVALCNEQPKWRILIVDDTADNRYLLKQQLESVGFNVHDVENGAEALRQFKEWQPDLIWMDMRMPVMDGYEATRRIRQLPGGDKVTILALTASAFKEQKAKILKAGCQEVLYKPYREQEIFEVMKQFLDIHYIYDEADEPVESARRQFSQQNWHEILQQLPAQWVDQLEQAILIGKLDKIKLLADSLGDEYSELAACLHKYAGHYDMAALRNMVTFDSEKVTGIKEKENVKRKF